MYRIICALLLFVPSMGAIAHAQYNYIPSQPPDAFQGRYFANLNVADSDIDITNMGTRNGNDPAGNICANVYTFSPDEQLISCCSCLVTPDGLVNLGVTRDLTSNTLTGVIPTSVVVKLLATAPAATTPTSCSNSAARMGVLAPGMRAWGTTVHAAPPAGTYQVTETA